MARERNSFKMGTVEMLILFFLSKHDSYVYEMTQMFKELSEGNMVIPESTLYPTFYKLMDKKYISDRAVRVGKKRTRVYYHLEELGRKRLNDLLEDYESVSYGIAKILSYNPSSKEGDVSDE